MVVPPWLSLTCAVLIAVWGVYRIRLGLRSEEAERRATAKKGLFALPRRTHLLIGVVYVLLGIGLGAIGLGWRPFSFSFGGDESSQPAPPAPPGAIPVTPTR